MNPAQQHKYELTYYGDDVLRHKAAPVEKVDDSIIELAQEMARIMYESQGVGLAGPQAGVSLDIFVADVGDELYVCMNPKITDRSEEKELCEEGCLSIPEVGVMIERPTEVEIEYMNLDGQVVRERFKGLMARAVQHEMDHLAGRLIIDYMGLVDRELIRKKLRSIAQKSKRRLL